MATLRQRRAAANPSDQATPGRDFTFSDYVEWVTSGDVAFPTSTVAASLGGSSLVEPPERPFDSYAANIYKRNGIVFACMGLRQAIFSEVTFKYQQVNYDSARPGKLFGSTRLGILEHPWPNGTTAELATRMIQDADLAGNFYAIERAGRLYRRNPQHVSIVLTGDPAQEEFVDVAGYVYQPQGPGGRMFTYLPEDICHWSPLPDPEAEYRGMSWLTPILREIDADNAATDHKAAYFRNGATPNFAVTMPEAIMTEAQFEDFRTKMQATHHGARNAYKTLYLAPGADVKPLGSSLEQLAFGDTQGRDETRIASAAGVPAVLVGLKESLQGSSLNTGTQGQARRRFADGTMKPLYRSASAALQTLAPPPSGSPARLWFDDSQVAFFREDRGDSAEIQSSKAATISTLVNAGYKPDSVIAAVEADDWQLLQHTGLFSVQLQEPGTELTKPAIPAQKKPAKTKPAPAA